MPLSSSAFSPAGVGKSSLLLRFADNTFSGECAPGVLLGRFGFEIPFRGARTHLPLPKVGNLVVLIPDEGRRSGGRRRLQGSVVRLNLSGSKESLEAHPFATQGLFCALTFKKRKS